MLLQLILPISTLQVVPSLSVNITSGAAMDTLDVISLFITFNCVKIQDRLQNRNITL